MIADWLDPLYDAEQMRAIDRWAIEERDIPSLDLMERAGAGLALTVDRLVPRGPIVVVCGKGNNGGDGFVAGRLLRELGRTVRVLTLAAPDDHRGDAAENLRRLEGAHEPFSTEGLDDAAVVVDAIFGTGFDGEPRGAAKDAIEAIAVLDAVVVSADVPSGVDGSTGEAALGLRHGDADGDVRGREDRALDRAGQAAHGRAAGHRHRHPGGRARPGAGRTADAARPRARSRSPRAGHEVHLRARRRRRRLARPDGRAVPRGRGGDARRRRLRDGVRPPLARDDLRAAPARGHDARAARRERVACARGAPRRSSRPPPGPGRSCSDPGSGAHDGALAFAREVAASADVALLLDADGLNAHAGAIDDLAARTAATVLTPHAGELGRLLGRSSEEIEAHRLTSAREAARRAQAIVVLKGDDTIVAAPDGTVAINGLGAPALATAGTGDVLSGVIGAFLAKGMDPFTAACAGVRRHAAAGRVAASEHGPDGVIASDVVAALPRALEGETAGGAMPGVPEPATAEPRIP